MSSISKTTASSSCSSTITTTNSDDEGGLRRGPWTLEEDNLLIHYISSHGEGRWNLLAKRSGLKRTGKSCRLRWLNYLKPDVKRGNLSPQEQLLILDLHFKWGNRWSKIAQHLPGRTDNEIKNYWRTRVQKQARHLKIDPNSNQFQELIRCVWMPRLIQKIHTQSSSSSTLINNNNQFLCNPLASSIPLQQQQQDNDVVLLPYYNPSFPVMDDKDKASRNSLSDMSSSSCSSSSSTTFTSAVNSEQMPFQSENYDMETLFTLMGGGYSNDHHHVLYSGDQNQWLATDEFIYGSLWNMELDDELSQFQER